MHSWSVLFHISLVRLAEKFCALSNQYSDG